MRESASKLNSNELVVYYTSIVANIEKEIELLRIARKKEGEALYNEIPTRLKDEFSGLYAELLHRLGYDELTISDVLKNHRILNYKNGEEQYFIKQNLSSTSE